MSNTPTIPLNFTYPKSEHLKSRKAIEQLFKSGQSFFIYPYKVIYQIVGVPLAGTQLTPNPVHPQGASLQHIYDGDDNHGTPIIHYPLSIVYYPLLSGFAVSSKNFKRAVDRNRIKRLGREAYRLHKQALMQQLAANNQQLQVFFIYTDKKLPDFKLIQPKIRACLKRLAALTSPTP